jgi:acyl-CoA reductase-like NAD-dependent aldehyde dehydrogenase
MTTTISPEIDLAALVERARSAQRTWAAAPIRQRLAPVESFRRLLVEACDEFCTVIGREVGKQPGEVVGGEVLPTADACRFLVREAPRILAPRRVRSGQRPLWLWGQTDTVHRRPRGVVGIIGTWNYPLLLNAVQILHALTAGNAVIWKPSEVPPQFADLLHRLLRQAGFSDDLVQVLPATREMGPVLAELAIDHVVFTGSAAVGRKLAARLGERLVSSTMELSGCDAQLVLEDADVGLAARAAWFGCTINRGQTCIAVRRAFVHRRLYPGFCEQLKTLASAAPPMQLVVPAEVGRVERLVQDAVARGGRCLVEGPTTMGDGVCRPAVVVDANPEMELCRESAFAPVMAVLPFEGDEEVLRLESACPYALGASVFTPDIARAERLARRLRSGTVAVNDVVVPTAHPATPFGGSGASGWGVTQGAEGLLEMTVPQTVSVRKGTFRPHYDIGDSGKLAGQEALVRTILQATHAPRLGQRLQGWWRLINSLVRGP